MDHSGGSLSFISALWTTIAHWQPAPHEYSREYRLTQSVETLCTESKLLDSEFIDIARKATFYKLIVEKKNNPYAVIALWNKVYRTDFLNKNGIRFIPEARKGQDRLFNADVLNTTSKVYYIHEVLYHYRCWEDSRTNRYDSNIPLLTQIELSSLQDIMCKHKLESIVGDYFKCRICTRMYTCMRLYYFHPQNKSALRNKIKAVKDMTLVEPYHTALKLVDMRLLNYQEKVFVFCMKHNLYFLLYILVWLKSLSTNRYLSKE